MYTEISLEQGSLEWHAYRSTHIGASDAPVIMGVSPWKTLKKLYDEKLGLRENFVTPTMKRGLELEDRARASFKVECGLTVRPCVIESKTYPWMCASLDGISECGQIVEIKCPGQKDHNLALQGVVPAHYYPQLQHQMYVAGVQSMFYYSFDGVTGSVVKVSRDDGYIEAMIKAEKQFYDNVMDYNVPEYEEDEFELIECTEFNDLAQIYRRDLLQAKEYEEALKMKIAEVECTRQLIINYAQGRSIKGHGLTVKKTSRKGMIDYKRIPELLGVDLEKYRKETTSSWKIEVGEEKSG